MHRKNALGTSRRRAFGVGYCGGGTFRDQTKIKVIFVIFKII